MDEKYILIDQLSGIMEANKSSIPDLSTYFNQKIPVPEYLFKMLKQMEFMIIDEEEEDIFQHFSYPIQISVHSSDGNHLFCTLEDINCSE